MSSNEADNIDKLYKNYDILNDAKEKIAEVSVNCEWWCMESHRHDKRTHTYVQNAQHMESNALLF